MENKDLELFEDIFDSLSDHALGLSLRQVRSFVNEHPFMISNADLEDIEHDYSLMLGYMRRGFIDPQRETVYENLVNRLYNFVSSLNMAYKTRNIPFFMETAHKSMNQTLQNEKIRAELENFTADQAMLSLEPAEARKEKSKRLYEEHNRFMQSLFCSIIISSQWNDGDEEFYENLLLSPLVDTIDIQLIVSALTLAVMNNMDINKFAVLINVYRKAAIEKVRQRALIGWVFSLSADMRIHARFEELVKASLEDPKVVKELVELQKQIIYCMNTEQDTDKIQKDIIPDLIKHNSTNIRRFGITEKDDEDPMQDVFDPGADDRNMEKVEESFQKMMNMQKEGTDIYFGGFSQMKRFPFFYNLANWFCPFYPEHPEIAGAMDKLEGTSLVANILAIGPFCDSDKYSFTLAISSIMSHLPKDMREMLNSTEALGVSVGPEEQASATYIRRMILQDMYRFFRLYNHSKDIENPFSINNFLFATDVLFEDTEVYKSLPELCFFAFKHKNKDAIEVLMGKYYDDNDPKILYLHGLYELNYNKEPYSALRYLTLLNDIEPDNKKALSLLARAYFECDEYDDAAECYEELYENDPTNNSIALNYCVAMAKAEMYDDAINLIYKLSLDMPDSVNVMRVLAWTLMGLNRLEQAEKEYKRILGTDEVETGDWLNAGYSAWFLGNINDAVERFKHFMALNNENGVKKENDSITDDILDDYDFITEHGISATDVQLMIDLVDEENFS
ncbi:MAG: tetratricopeptide repeat protein [Prevotella sp.]|nr:tetratricopeptide repeat protein [Prevotella sp.]